MFTDQWFWAFLAAVGWALAFAVTGTKTPGRSLGFGIFMFILAEVPRVILPLPFVEQPRITSVGPWLAIVGGLILAASLVFGTPVLRIVPLTAPDHHEPLRTNGLYAVVRHPLMVCDILWPLGWSMIFVSIIGVGLTAVGTSGSRLSSAAPRNCTRLSATRPGLAPVAGCGADSRCPSGLGRPQP